ncbi:hypothetical protein [Pseudomonas akapageensis]|uniref:hypothetical protein n=1 Tax=Pseudomonas akapageensis TaxID=2609961 RepID=UPI00140C8CD9|nr:hypothetical protein [Pseudomonas akapageensis]
MHDKVSSQSLSLPADFMHEIEGVYNDVYIEDISGSGVGEVVFRLAGSDVNSCSRILYYSKAERSLKELVFDKGGLCNFRVQHGYVVSSYREGAAWNENVYKINDGKVSPIISDSCIGCGEVQRKEHRQDGSFVRILVSDNADFEKRTPLTADVVASRAEIFSSPEAAQPTKKYLVRGNKVVLLNFNQSRSGETWVEFRYSGIGTVEGWLKCSDLEGCSEF